jgi:hypothetical protein
MSSAPNSTRPAGRAEKAFREAFDRLKKGKPERLPKNSFISQNNIAKEAGRDPSALRKTRFPTLIAEIQRWVIENPADTSTSPRQTVLTQRRRNRSLKDKIEAVTAERDHALSLLVEADARIVELTLENLELRAKLPAPHVTHLRKRQ